MEQYDIVLLQKNYNGLTKQECMRLFDMLPDGEAYPLEMYSADHYRSAIGFYTESAVHRLEEAKPLIQRLLDKKEPVSGDNSYQAGGLCIHIA